MYTIICNNHLQLNNLFFLNFSLLAHASIILKYSEIMKIFFRSILKTLFTYILWHTNDNNVPREGRQISYIKFR